MDLRTYGKAIRQSWWILLLLVVLGAAGGAFVTLQATPAYVSTVTFFVSTPTETTGSPIQAQQYAQRRINSYVQLLDSEDFARSVITSSGVPLSVGAVQSAISARTDLNTVLLTVNSTASDPAVSLSLATAVSTELGKLVSSLDSRDTVDTSPIVLNVVSGPTLNPTPVSPRPTLNIGLGVLVGLALGLGLAIFRQVRDTSIRSLKELRAISGLPGLGVIPLDHAAAKAPVLVGDQLRSERAEAFRQIRTSIQFADLDTQPQVVLVTSAVTSESKSSTAANLAIVYAETGRRVLLIEADMRKPRISDYLGLERAVGLSNVLANQAVVADVVQPWGREGLSVLPSGSTPPNPSELLGSQHIVDLIAELRTSYDIIIVDTPPLLPVTDAAVAATWADGVVMVVRHGAASRAKITTALQSLASVDATMLGCVLTMAPNGRR